MNFLAHVYLSGGNEELIIGNFIADSVKGKEFDKYSEGIKEGILLHRKIDFFTDRHPVVAETILKLKPHFDKYSSIVSDIYYDHFLALHWNKYSDIPLLEYTKSIYTFIENHMSVIPKELQMAFPYMKKNNWLYNYQTFYGLERAFIGMSKRASFVSHMEKSVVVLKEQYTAFEEDFLNYFPLLETYVEEERNKVTNKLAG